MILTMIKIILTAAMMVITFHRVDTGEIKVQNIIEVDNEYTIAIPVIYDEATVPIREPLYLSTKKKIKTKVVKEEVQQVVTEELELMGHADTSIYDGLDDDRVEKLYKALSQATQDEDYNVNPLKITGKNREILEALVYGEAGDEGFVGQCLVAQCIRDTMSRMNTTDIKKVIKTFKYAGSTKNGTSQSCKDAVEFIFDKGGYVVKQRIIYFYAPKLVSSKFHESQDFVIEWGGHRFFDDSGWN